MVAAIAEESRMHKYSAENKASAKKVLNTWTLKEVFEPEFLTQLSAMVESTLNGVLCVTDCARACMCVCVFVCMCVCVCH